MIIGSVVTITVMKFVKKFSKKKTRKVVDYKKETFKMEHNCSDCSAECILRDAVQNNPIAGNNEDLCGKINVKSN